MDGLLEAFLSNMEELIDNLEADEPLPGRILDEMLYEISITRTLERQQAWEEDNAAADSYL